MAFWEYFANAYHNPSHNIRYIEGHHATKLHHEHRLAIVQCGMYIICVRIRATHAHAVVNVIIQCGPD